MTLNEVFPWIRNDGQKSPPLVANPQPLHGGATASHMPVWIEHEGKKLRVVEFVEIWSATETVQNIRDAFVCHMSDGSLWCLIVELNSGTVWTGERLPDDWTSP